MVFVPAYRQYEPSVVIAFCPVLAGSEGIPSDIKMTEEYSEPVLICLVTLVRIGVKYVQPPGSGISLNETIGL